MENAAYQDNEFLSTKQLATRLNVSEQAIVKWTSENRLPHIKFGRLNRYVWPDIQKKLNTGCLLLERKTVSTTNIGGQKKGDIDMTEQHPKFICNKAEQCNFAKCSHRTPHEWNQGKTKCESTCLNNLRGVCKPIDMEKHKERDILLKAADEIAAVFDVDMGWVDSRRSSVVKILKRLVNSERPDMHKPKSMPSNQMTSDEIKKQCDFISDCLESGVDEIREDDEWQF